MEPQAILALVISAIRAGVEIEPLVAQFITSLKKQFGPGRPEPTDDELQALRDLIDSTQAQIDAAGDGHVQAPA